MIVEKSTNEILIDFLDTFGETIYNYCKNKKKICSHISGGYDTRAIVSVLEDYNIEYDMIFCKGYNPKTTNEDIPIINKLQKLLHGKLITINLGDNKDQLKFLHKNCTGYNIVFSGVCMSEYLNKSNLLNLNHGYEKANIRHFIGLYEVMKIKNNLIIPMIEPEVLEAYNKIPKRYLKDCFIQKKIIEYYEPKLNYVDFTHSYYSPKLEKIKERLKI